MAPTNGATAAIAGGALSDFYRHAVLDQIKGFQRLAERRFPDATVADAAVNYVLEQLQADGFARVRAHDGRASLATFLTTVAAHLIEDYARKRFGRVTVPAWVRERGGLWLRLYELMCRERYSLRDAVGVAAVLFGADAAPVEDAARAIRARYPRCGEPGAGEIAMDELPETADPESAPPSHRAAGLADGLIEQERADLLAWLRAHLATGPDAADPDPAGPDPTAPGARLPNLTLSPEERLLLSLECLHGLSTVDAGKRLGLGAHQAHGKRRRALERIRRAIAEARQGWGREDLA